MTETTAVVEAHERPAHATRDQLTAPPAGRTGFVGPHGPLLGNFKTSVDLDLEEAFKRECAKFGTDPSSAIRNWIHQVIRGQTYDEACLHAAQRRASMLGVEVRIESVISPRSGAH